MKKLFAFLLLGVFMISLASANIFDISTWDDKVIFHEPEKIGEYGKYEINDTTFWLFNNKPIKTIELIENKYSIFTAWNIKEIEIFKPSKLFDKTNYLDKNQEEDKRDLLSSETHLYREWETKTRIINNQSCLTYEILVNKTEVCSEWQDNSYEETYDKWSNWQVYNFQEVQVGLYQTKTIVTRQNRYTGTIDWVDENEGHILDKWATWWDNNWQKKREISSLNGTISALYNITYDANMRTDFGDLRFLDNATELIELNYTIISKVDSTSAMIRVNNLNQTSVMMYYNNPSPTTTTSNSPDVYYRPEGGYFFYEDARDFSGNGNNGTINGADFTTSGYIDNAFDFVTENTDNISLGHIINTATGTPFSIAMWIKPREMGSNNKFIGQDTSGDRGFSLSVETGTRKIRFYNGIVSTSETTNLVNLDEWNFIGVTYDSSQNLIINVNGDSETFNSVTIVTDTTHDTYIGFDGRTHYGNVTIDEVYIYNYTLSTEQLLALTYQNNPPFVVGAEQDIGAEISLISPEDNLSTNQTFQTFKCNATHDSNIANLTFILDGVDTFTNSTVGIFIDLTYSENLTQGNYKWSCRAETIAEEITQSENRTLIIHTTPLDVVIHNPEPIIGYHLLGTDLLLNWTVTEGTENLTEHVTNCTYEYNEVITVLNNTVCTQINQTNFTYVSGVNNLTFNVTDEFDLVNSTLVEWEFNLLTNSINFSTQARSGALENFTINVTIADKFSGISMLLNYNGTNHSMTSESSNHTRKYTTQLIIPSVSTETNITLFFTAILSEGENITIISTDPENQTVSPFLIDDCSVFTNILLSFEMVDEDSLDEINGTIEITLDIFSIGTTELINTFNTSFDYKIGEDSNICLENITEDYSMSYQIRHFGDETEYFKKYRNIQMATISNDTLFQNITLYNLNLSRGQSFNVIVVGNLLSSVGNAGLLLDTQRQYLASNEFRSVESPITDSSGIAIANLVQTEEVYNFLISFDGELLGTFNNYQVKCANAALGQCSITLNLASATGEPIDFETFGNITQIFLLNTNTNILHHTFSSTDGASKTVRSLVIKNDGYANETICDSTTSGTSGTILCTIPVAYRNVSICVQTFLGIEMVGTKCLTQGPDIDWQGADILIMLLMFSSLVLLFIAHPITIIIGALLGLAIPVIFISSAEASMGTLFGAVLFYIAGGIIAIIVIAKKKF